MAESLLSETRDGKLSPDLDILTLSTRNDVMMGVRVDLAIVRVCLSVTVRLQAGIVARGMKHPCGEHQQGVDASMLPVECGRVCEA